MTILVINGAYDVLNYNHKQFISSLIKLVNPEELVVLLSSDSKVYRDAYKKKSIYRPLFSYEWREEDLVNWFAIDYPQLQVTITKATENTVEELSYYLNKPNYIVGANSKYSYLKGNNIITRTEYISKLNTNILDSIKEATLKAECNLIKVGSVLVREGEVIKTSSNGLISKYKGMNFCIKCGEEMTNKCSYYFAEELLLDDMKIGDDIITTYNPTLSVAKKLIEKGIRRLVYLYEYIDNRSIDYLRDNNIQIRKAG